MYIDIHKALPGASHPGLCIPIPVIRHPAESPQTNNSPGVTVTLSDAARRIASSENVTLSNAAVKKSGNTSELRELLKQYDFHSITPKKMSELGGELFKRGEINNEAACSFTSVEMNTVVEMDPEKSIDMVAHFKWMLDNVETAAQSDSTLTYGVAYRKNASQALANILSFINSDREHISSSMP